MKPRKNPKVNLENKRSLFFSVGLCLSLAAVLMAFEYKTVEAPFVIVEPDDPFEKLGEEIMATKFPEPPKPKKRKAVVIQPTVVASNVVKESDLVKSVFEPEVTDEPTGFVEGFDDGVALPIERIDEPPVNFAEKMPEPVGGMQAFYKYLSKNLDYPAKARRINIQGRVYVQFVISKSGEIKDIKAIKGMGYGLDEEAVRAILNYQPGWKPGKQGDRPVAVKMIFPIYFKLNQ